MSGAEANFTGSDSIATDHDGVNVVGLVSIVLFYAIVLAIGIWAGWQQRKAGAKANQETVMLAGRNLGLFVGILTMGGRPRAQHCGGAYCYVTLL